MANGKFNGTKEVAVTLNDSLFKAYIADPNSGPRIYERNGIITLCGMVSPKSQLSADGVHLIGNISPGYRPAYEISAIMQGSGASRWFFQVLADGKIQASRYTDGANYKAIPANVFMPFHITYVVGGVVRRLRNALSQLTLGRGWA